MACRLRGGSCPKQPDAAAASCRVFQNSRGNTGGYPVSVCGWRLRAAAFFPVEEKKDLAGLSSRIHGYSSAAGFMLLAAAPPLAGFLAYRAGFSMLALFSWLCFFWPLFSSLRSSWPISPASGIRPLRGRGCGSGLPCCVCIFPWHALCLPYCKLRKKASIWQVIARERPFSNTSPIFQRRLLFSARSSAAEAGYTPKGSPSRRRTVPRPRGLM